MQEEQSEYRPYTQPISLFSPKKIKELKVTNFKLVDGNRMYKFQWDDDLQGKSFKWLALSSIGYQLQSSIDLYETNNKTKVRKVQEEWRQNYIDGRVKTPYECYDRSRFNMESEPVDSDSSYTPSKMKEPKYKCVKIEINPKMIQPTEQELQVLKWRRTSQLNNKAKQKTKQKKQIILSLSSQQSIQKKQQSQKIQEKPFSEQISQVKKQIVNNIEQQIEQKEEKDMLKDDNIQIKQQFKINFKKRSIFSLQPDYSQNNSQKLSNSVMQPEQPEEPQQLVNLINSSSDQEQIEQQKVLVKEDSDKSVQILKKPTNLRQFVINQFKNLNISDPDFLKEKQPQKESQKEPQPPQIEQQSIPQQIIPTISKTIMNIESSPEKRYENPPKQNKQKQQKEQNRTTKQKEQKTKQIHPQNERKKRARYYNREYIRKHFIPHRIFAKGYRPKVISINRQVSTSSPHQLFSVKLGSRFSSKQHFVSGQTLSRYYPWMLQQPS